MADDLDMWWSTPYSFAPSEYTTAPEMRQERISQGLGWDTSRPGREFLMRALMQLPLALRSAASAMPPPLRTPPNPNMRPWSQNEEWALSFNQARDPGRISYDITHRGEPIGLARGFVDGDTAHLTWIGPRLVGDTLGPQDIGVGGLRALRGYIRSDFPQVRTFTGSRISGARRGPAAQQDPVGDTVNQTVRMKSLAPLGASGFMRPPDERY